MSKRLLTEEEIEYVLSELKPVNGLDKNVSETIYRKVINNIKNTLRGTSIYPEKMEELKTELTRQYYTSQITPGVSVGIATSQSIGERQTQLALNSFHSTGMTTMTVVAGVPRFNELVNATKNPKSVISKIFFNAKPQDIQTIREYIPLIKHIRFENVVKSHSLKKGIQDDWYKSFKHIFTERWEKVKKCNQYVRFQCDLQVLYESRIHLMDIVECIMSQFEGIECVWSPDEVGVLDIWFNTNELKQVTENKNITKENKVFLFVDEILLPQLMPVSIKGIQGIDQVDYSQSVDRSEWYLDALGYNLQELFILSFVDETRTISNHMWEIYKVLGIEATREFLIQEFVEVISVESFINLRHIQLLVDVMLFTGDISSISRYGVHKNQSGALTKCSFEESMDQILKAGIYGENEQINGVSGAIITGKMSNIGTGLCDLLYDIPE